MRWYRLAADQGDASAQYNLGGRYANGLGVPQDEAEAVRWYRLAADQGNASAQYNLGLRYANGEGVLKDDAEAVRWYRLSADQGDASAQNNLGLRYDNGEGVLKDSRPRPCAGIGSQPIRGTPLRRPTSGSVTPTARVSSRIPCSRTCGSTSLVRKRRTKTAREGRDNLERDMTRDEISRATELARECMASDYQDCQP